MGEFPFHTEFPPYRRKHTKPLASAVIRRNLIVIKGVPIFILVLIKRLLILGITTVLWVRLQT